MGQFTVNKYYVIKVVHSIIHTPFYIGKTKSIVDADRFYSKKLAREYIETSGHIFIDPADFGGAIFQIESIYTLTKNY